MITTASRPGGPAHPNQPSEPKPANDRPIDPSPMRQPKAPPDNRPPTRGEGEAPLIEVYGTAHTLRAIEDRHRLLGHAVSNIFGWHVTVKARPGRVWSTERRDDAAELLYWLTGAGAS